MNTWVMFFNCSLFKNELCMNIMHPIFHGKITRVCEQDNRTIVKTTRNMFYFSKLPILFWVEAIHTTTYMFIITWEQWHYLTKHLMKLGLVSKLVLFALEFLGVLHLHTFLKTYIINFLLKAKSVSQRSLQGLLFMGS